MIENRRLFELFRRYHQGKASESETNDLMELLKELPEEQLTQMLQETWKLQDMEQPFFESTTREKLFSKLQPSEQPGKVVAFGIRRKIFRVSVAAAAVLVFLVFGFWFLVRQSSDSISKSDQVVKTETKSPGSDISPGGDKAILTLADGTQVILDTADNGAVTEQGGIKVIKIDGQLSYLSPSGGGKGEDEATKVLYNTITTPRGGQYQLVLADGTKVWLNAESSLRFPTAFTGSERKVELTGEGYFEVRRISPAGGGNRKVENGVRRPGVDNVPFFVDANGVITEVLGTHFNVNAYSDESKTKITLIEGSVKVGTAAGSVIIKPGEQAAATSNIKPQTSNNINLEQVVAWKNGLIYFDGADVAAIMRQISRWYNVEAGYEGDPKVAHLSGKVSRNLNLSQVIKVLETSGIDIRMEGNKLIATPKP